MRGPPGTTKPFNIGQPCLNCCARVYFVQSGKRRDAMTCRNKLLLMSAGIALACGVPLRGASPPAFEVASVKPHKPGDSRRGMPGFLPGRFSAVGVPLKILIAVAY